MLLYTIINHFLAIVEKETLYYCNVDSFVNMENNY